MIHWLFDPASVARLLHLSKGVFYLPASFPYSLAIPPDQKDFLDQPFLIRSHYSAEAPFVLDLHKIYWKRAGI
jgi:hypothetical protein